MDIQGLGRFRDAKVWPGGGRAWDWGETGTDHRPGIQPADVTELLTYGPEVVVLGCGRHGRLEVCPETMALLREHGVTVVRQNSGAAFATYNRLLREGRKVAGLFHTTC